MSLFSCKSDGKIIVLKLYLLNFLKFKPKIQNLAESNLRIRE
jgi:hypothetical protein